MKLFILICLFALVNYSYAGEQQWTTILIENHTSKTLQLTDVSIHYGKWYRTGCISCELRTVEQSIGPGSHTIINAAGRMLSPTGTDGEFAIYDGLKNEKTTNQILHLYFSVPFLIGTENTINVKPFDMEKYPIEMYGGKLRSTSLGVVTIKIFEKETIVNDN